MYFLPTEIKFDILKYLNFEQLLNVQQTNYYLKNFVEEYKMELARKKFDRLCLSNQYMRVDKYKFLQADPRLFDFELSEQLEEKWKCGIKRKIPVLLRNIGEEVIVYFEIRENIESEPKMGCFDDGMYRRFLHDDNVHYIKLQNYPKSVKEMKNARYLLEQIFSCAFESINFKYAIFNTEMIELLFDENKTNIPLQFHSRRARLYIFGNNQECFLEFILNHISAVEFTVYIDFNVEECTNKLVKILTNVGNRLYNVSFNYRYSELYDLIIQHIETSNDLSKMVKEIRFAKVVGNLIISKRAENVEKCVHSDLKVIKYQLSNKYDPEMKFSICIEENDQAFNTIEIKRIN